MTGGGPVRPVFRRARDIPAAPTALERILDMHTVTVTVTVRRH